jgi:hypothetical protein
VFFTMSKVKDKALTAKLELESATYQDIVLGDFYESFYNNSWKLEMMFEWSFKHCQFQYLFKVDDDSFINMQNLFKLLETLGENPKKIYLGRREIGTTIRGGKYRLSYEEYRLTVLPAFIAGGAVLLSYDVVRDIIPYFFSGNGSQPVMKLEDVYTAYLTLNANIPSTNNKAFRHSANAECVYSNAAIALHFWTNDVLGCMKKNFKKMIESQKNDGFTHLHYGDIKNEGFR